MSYKRGSKIPPQLIEQIQEYIDGQTVYIPRKPSKRRGWGESNGATLSLAERNEEIY